MSTIVPMHLRRKDEECLAEHPELGGYRVVDGRYGTAIYGPLPASDLPGLQATWEAKGYTIWDLGVASAIGATIAATSPEGSKAWRAWIDEQLATRFGCDMETRWVCGCDAGLSAMCIMACLAASDAAVDRAASRLRRQGEDGDMWRHPPGDPDDLGRCVRLLDLFPGWRERLPEVAAINPEWAPFVRQWVELETLYRRELPTGDCPLTYARMKALAEENLTVTETTVDLSGLEVTGELGSREGSYFDALDGVLEAMIYRHEELPERLYVAIPPEPGARVLLWSRNGEDATVERAILRANDEGEAER